MHIGVATPLLDGFHRPETLARLVEDRGFESFWVGEHTHLPVGSRGGDGELLDPVFSTMLDPFVALAAVATATTTLRFGTSVCLVAQRDPIVTAKATATLDVLSGGRFSFGVGAGWIRQEMATHGVDPRTRMRRLVEHTAAVRELWTAEEAEFHGEFVDFGPVLSRPKPVQAPHPPILVGGDGPGVTDRVQRLGAEWMPIAGGDDTLRRWRTLCEEAGRAVPLTMGAVPSDRGVLDGYRGAGVDRCVVWLPDEGREPLGEVERFLDALVVNSRP